MNSQNKVFKKNIPIYDISAGKIIQLKKLLSSGWNHTEASYISEILFYCKNQPEIYRNTSENQFNNYRSFSDSINIHKNNATININKITSGKNPPIIKTKGKVNKFSVNFNYFNELYNREFNNHSEILNCNKLTQDRFFCYLYGWVPAIIFSQLIYWHNIEKEPGEYKGYTERNIGKQVYFSKRTISQNIKKLMNISEPPFIAFGERGIGSEIEYNFENIKKHQIFGLKKLEMFNKYEYNINNNISIKLKLLPIQKTGIIK